MNVRRAIVTCLLAPLFLEAHNFAAIAQTDPSSLNIVVLDGSNISYAAHKPKTNREVLEELLPKLLPEFRVKVKYADVLNKDATGAYLFDPSQIVRNGPRLIVMHWSAFKAADNRKDCDPDGSQVQQECARALVALMEEVFANLKEQPRFIIYSRQNNLCEESFRIKLFKTLHRGSKLAPATGLISMSLTARNANFMSRNAQADLKALARKLLGQSKHLHENNTQGLCLLSSP